MGTFSNLSSSEDCFFVSFPQGQESHQSVPEGCQSMLHLSRLQSCCIPFRCLHSSFTKKILRSTITKSTYCQFRLALQQNFQSTLKKHLHSLGFLRNCSYLCFLKVHQQMLCRFERVYPWLKLVNFLYLYRH